MVCPTSSAGCQRRASPFLALVGTAILVVAWVAPAGAQWRLEAWLGQAWSVPSPVTFSQINQPAIRVNGDWSTRPFAPTWYYSGRIAKWSGDAAWAFEYMHHKIYLDNPPPGVQVFQVTNGVNFLLAERLWRKHGWEFGAGAGPLYAVPVSSVRRLVYDNAHGIFHSQYELAGAAVQANLARRLRLLPFTFGSLSVKATGGYLHVHIANGHAVTSNFALHVQYGLSLQSKLK
jgi:hypothetical protein